MISGGLDYTPMRTMAVTDGLITQCSTTCPGDLGNLAPSLGTESVSTYLGLKVCHRTIHPIEISYVSHVPMDNSETHKHL